MDSAEQFAVNKMEPLRPIVDVKSKGDSHRIKESSKMELRCIGESY